MSQDYRPLELRTHTRLWQVEKRLYKLYDFTLPVPVSLRMLGILIVAFVPWSMLMVVLGIKFAPPVGHLIWIAPPAIAAWYANRPVAEGKKLGELCVSQIRYFVNENRTYTGLRPFTEPHRVIVGARVWEATGLDLTDYTDFDPDEFEDDTDPELDTWDPDAAADDLQPTSRLRFGRRRELAHA